MSSSSVQEETSVGSGAVTAETTVFFEDDGLAAAVTSLTTVFASMFFEDEEFAAAFTVSSSSVSVCIFSSTNFEDEEGWSGTAVCGFDAAKEIASSSSCHINKRVA